MENPTGHEVYDGAYDPLQDDVIQRRGVSVRFDLSVAELEALDRMCVITQRTRKQMVEYLVLGAIGAVN